MVIDKEHFKNRGKHNKFGGQGSSRSDKVYREWIEDGFKASRPAKFKIVEPMNSKSEYWRKKFEEEFDEQIKNAAIANSNESYLDVFESGDLDLPEEFLKDNNAQPGAGKVSDQKLEQMKGEAQDLQLDEDDFLDADIDI